MKKIAFFLLAAGSLIACRKSNDVTGRAEVPLTIIETQTPATATAGQPLTARLRTESPNLCYQFERIEVQQTAAREYAIGAVGSLPKGDAVCAQALLRVDTTAVIPTLAAGQNILRFYNSGQLFRADTVQAN